MFRTNQDIFKTSGEEVFESKNMTGNRVVTPKYSKWDYARELHPDNIEIWEVIYEDNWGLGVYAAWEPYAEFYMIKHIPDAANGVSVYDTYYGPGAQSGIMQFMVEHKIPFSMNDVWVEPEDMWLHQESIFFKRHSHS
ncbi:hypothetical protein UFOVP190_95 [uncultured Caudovirales phage]|uniref:Uncharacterized protein n=1 Tax=uncultured Caudovirales phage TaxID=2100421 RepID=A0A6J7WK84_9CAUD|nr:hypothetical protein UFOVP190_95 [uncultured Caudovirales phage]